MRNGDDSLMNQISCFRLNLSVGDADESDTSLSTTFVEQMIVIEFTTLFEPKLVVGCSSSSAPIRIRSSWYSASASKVTVWLPRCRCGRHQGPRERPVGQHQPYHFSSQSKMESLYSQTSYNASFDSNVKDADLATSQTIVDNVVT